MRSMDWAATPLGPPEGWPQSLRTAVSILLNSRYPMFIFWGPHLVKIYNDGYRPITGAKHPWALGRPGPEVWPEIWDTIGPMVDRVVRRGEATWSDDLMLFMERNGFPEEVYFTFSYSPIRDESGGIGGMFCACTETTGKVLGERRLRTLRDLAATPAGALTTAEACSLSARVLGANPADVPFSLLYLLEDDGASARLAAASGMPEGTGTSPARVDLGEAAWGWPLGRVVESLEPERVAGLARLFPDPPKGPWPEPPSEAVVLPVVAQGHDRAAGVLVLGVSSRRTFDGAYADFFALVAGQVASTIAKARGREGERRRAEALAEIDRLKTTFFSNVSHEFRTPLTLMLGPTRDALESPEGALQGADLQAVHRNGLRLLKLVNALLDFSRIEAGRLEASREPTDLATLTTDLASSFRSAMERGGLTLDVQCAPLSGPVPVDREMWEKIVLNLLSNAFKFTLSGGVRVELREAGDDVVLVVADTGVGIRAPDLPRVFERFHRIEGAAARTHEGSGIGLALVADLVKLHGGTIDVSSEPGRGSAFTVRIPRVSPPAPTGGEASPATAGQESSAGRGGTYVEEALRWLPGDTADTPDAGPSRVAAGRVLVADDNADMREYVARLLGEHWAVETVADGAQALRSVREDPPDVVVADAMMPNLDGFGLIKGLRADPRTAELPVLVLSARAGEESRVEGLGAGAVDYMAKPFAARELVARVRVHLERSRARAERLRAERRFRDMADAAPVMLWVTSPPGDCTFLSRAWYEFTGQTEGEALGFGWLDAVHPDDRQRARDAFEAANARRVPFSHDYRLRARDGRYRWAIDAAQPWLSANGAFLGYVGAVIDIGDRKEAEQQALSANRAKDEFLAMLGHELRNPLSPIVTSLHLMRMRGRGGPELDVIERQVNGLIRLVDDLLDVSRITGGKISLRRERVRIGDVVARSVEMASPLLEQRRQRLQLDVAPEELVVEGDVGRLAQVVSNLLTNAAKYSEPASSIQVRACRVHDHVELSVIDEGIGIAPGMLERIFDTFVQEPQALDRAKGGLGLGLSIVRGLVELHGGKVRARSGGAGQGTEVTVELPAAPVQEDAVPPPLEDTLAAARKPAPGRRILVVDDNRDAADTVAEALASSGHEVRVANDGPTALTVARAFQPSICIVDIGLPIMDGYELALALRESGFGPVPRLIAVTGYGQEADRRRALDAGFDSHVVKPVAFEQLQRAIEDVAGTP